MRVTDNGPWKLASLILALAASSLAATFSSAQTPPAPAVTVAKPVVKEIAEFDDFIGRFEAVDQVDIRARVSGYVDTISFQDGATVKAGDLLFTIDQRPYKAALDEAQASLESAQARLDFATVDLQRAEDLRKSGNISAQLFDQRLQALTTAKADVNRGQATLNRAKLDMQFTEVRAPIAGRMSRRLVSLGNLVGANATILANIVSTDPIHFYFDVDERSFFSYAKLSVGGLNVSNSQIRNDVAVATSNEKEPVHKGHLDFTDNRIDQASGTLRARAVIDNKDLSLVPGLFGRIRLLGTAPYQGILVPEEAIGSNQDRRIVYVVGPDNIVTLATVRVGPKFDGYRIIRSGLKGDETIIVNGLMRVRAGIKVAPRMTELPAVAAAN